MTTGAIVLIAGAVIILCSMLFALYNMFGAISGASNGGMAGIGFDGVFKRHIGAIIGAACGTFVSFIGAVLLLLPYLK